MYHSDSNDRTDKDWVLRCLNGHPEDYRHLVERYQGVLLSYLRGRLDDTSDPEGAAQEAFVRAFFALPKLQKPESFFGWVVGIARRVGDELRRSRKRSQEVCAEAARRRELGESECTKEWDAPLERAIAGLSEGLRDVVLLRYYGGLSCAQVAARLGMPLGTVTKYLSRAYALLRESPELAGKAAGDEGVGTI